MKIIDCFMYFDEDMLLDLRLNIMDKFVSKFVICESIFNVSIVVDEGFDSFFIS